MNICYCTTYYVEMPNKLKFENRFCLVSFLSCYSFDRTPFGGCLGEGVGGVVQNFS